MNCLPFLFLYQLQTRWLCWWETKTTNIVNNLANSSILLMMSVTWQEGCLIWMDLKYVQNIKLHELIPVQAWIFQATFSCCYLSTYRGKMWWSNSFFTKICLNELILTGVSIEAGNRWIWPPASQIITTYFLYVGTKLGQMTAAGFSYFVEFHNDVILEFHCGSFSCWYLCQLYWQWQLLLYQHPSIIVICQCHFLKILGSFFGQLDSGRNEGGP